MFSVFFRFPLPFYFFVLSSAFGPRWDTFVKIPTVMPLKGSTWKESSVNMKRQNTSTKTNLRLAVSSTIAALCHSSLLVSMSGIGPCSPLLCPSPLLLCATLQSGPLSLLYPLLFHPLPANSTFLGKHVMGQETVEKFLEMFMNLKVLTDGVSNFETSTQLFVSFISR